MEKYSVFERKHEKQVQAVKVDSVNLPSEEGIVQVTGNDNSEKLFREVERSGIHIVGMHAHAAQHRHNHASGQEGCHGQVSEHLNGNSHMHSHSHRFDDDDESGIRHIVVSQARHSIESGCSISIRCSFYENHKKMYDSVSVLEVGSSSKKQGIGEGSTSKVGLQHESNLPSICNDVLEMEYMCTNPGRGGRNENTYISDSYDDGFTATSKEQFSSVDTPEVLLRFYYSQSYFEVIAAACLQLQMTDKGTKRKKPREGGMKREERKYKKYVRFRNRFSSTTIGDANPIRTLGDYSKPSHEGYRNTIELLIGNNVVPLRSDPIRLVQNGCSFHELRSEDPNQHLKDFLKLMDSLDLDGENREKTRMRLFQFSFTIKLAIGLNVFQQDPSPHERILLLVSLLNSFHQEGLQNSATIS
ncbi:hypothetical protein Tco_0889291 [Tanacetum coccineum]